MMSALFLSGWGPAERMLADHLWQSTVFAALAGLLTLALRTNRAAARYWVWMAASLKFLVPLAVLVNLGSHFRGQTVAVAAQPPLTIVIDALSQPFSQSAAPGMFGASVAGTASVVPAVLLAVWLLGCATVLFTWGARWRQVSAVIRDAVPVTAGPELDALRRLEHAGGIRKPIALVSSKSSLEPGVFGILRPRLLWPQQMSGLLAGTQVDAILAHEVAHVRRHDNLTAMAHMVVEATFWFHPLVWWLGARLVDERERACDEEVLRLGSEPQVYAESILTTCRLYVESPLACVAGVTGSDLRKRIERIMRNRAAAALNSWRKLLLLTAGVVAVVGPIAIGVVVAPRLKAQASTPRLNPASNDPMTLNFVNASVKDVLGFIGRAAGITVAFDPAVVDRPITVKLDGVTLDQALKETTSIGQLTYKVVDEKAILVLPETPPRQRRGGQAGAGPPASDKDHPAFEVASVKPNRSGIPRITMLTRPGGAWDATNVTLGMLVRIAYQVQDFQVVGGPDWMYSDHFDVLAKAPASSAQGGVAGRFPLMLQSLLADRFSLSTRTENRELPVYALVMARSDRRNGPQLNTAAVDCSAFVGRGRLGGSPGVPPPPPPPPPRLNTGERPQCGMIGGLGRVLGGGVTMSQVAGRLSQAVGRVVIDKTGLTGAFDLDLQFAPEPDDPSLFTALQEQLGLKLESTKGQVDVLVIDRVERPTED